MFNKFTSTPKKRLPPVGNDSILESIRDLGSGVGKTVAHDVIGKVGSDVLTSLVGTPPRGGELQPNQEIKLPQEKEPVVSAVKRQELQPRLSDIRADQARVREQLEKVRAELKALAASLKSFHQEVEKAISETPVAPGIYHLNFFERLRSLLQVLRTQVEDSRNWLALWTNRKKQKHYWGLYKKHGTQFGLSSERTLATQAG